MYVMVIMDDTGMRNDHLGTNPRVAATVPVSLAVLRPGHIQPS